MKCIKCLNENSIRKQSNLPDMLSHLSNYNICKSCEKKSEKNNYKKHSDYYKKTQEKYRKELSNQYINRLIADNSDLKPSDIPEELTIAKRNYIKIKRLTKEKQNGVSN